MKSKILKMLYRHGFDSESVERTFSMFVHGAKVDYEEFNISYVLPYLYKTMQLREFNDGHFEYQVGISDDKKVSKFETVEMLDYYINEIDLIISEFIKIEKSINELLDVKSVRRKLNLEKLL